MYQQQQPTHAMAELDARLQALEEESPTRAIQAFLTSWLRTWSTLVDRVAAEAPAALKSCVIGARDEVRAYFDSVTTSRAALGVLVGSTPLLLNRMTKGYLPVVNTWFVQASATAYGAGLTLKLLSGTTRALAEQSKTLWSNLKKAANKHIRDPAACVRTVAIASAVSVGLGLLFWVLRLRSCNQHLAAQLHAAQTENTQLKETLQTNVQSIDSAKMHARNLALALGLLPTTPTASSSPASTVESGSHRGMCSNGGCHWVGVKRWFNDLRALPPTLSASGSK